MEKYSKCGLYGSVFLISIATGLIATNVYICEPCRKKLEDNPDINENNYVTTTQYTASTVMVNISGSMSTTTTQPIFNDINISIS